MSLGSSTQSTSVVNIASEGFSGWMQTTMVFKADSSTDILSFLAVGGPEGAPPFALLDGVTFAQAVPEPSSLILLTLGLVACGFVRQKRRSKAIVV